MLYEDPNVEASSDKRFHIELHFSPGSYADFDVPQYLTKPTNPIKNSKESSIEENLTQNPSLQSIDESISAGISISSSHSGHSLYQNQNSSAHQLSHQHKMFGSKKDKLIKSPTKNIMKKFPFKQQKGYNKELQTLPEPGILNEMGTSFESKNAESDDNFSRSFEDEHHQRRMLFIKSKLNTAKELYNHYNTFHGSVATNYLPLGQVFRNRTISFGTNSSPDLNQALLVAKSRKSVSSNLFCKCKHFISIINNFS